MSATAVELEPETSSTKETRRSGRINSKNTNNNNGGVEGERCGDLVEEVEASGKNNNHHRPHHLQHHQQYYQRLFALLVISFTDSSRVSASVFVCWLVN